MFAKIKNIIIFLAIGTIFVLIYIFFIKKTTPTDSLITSSSSDAVGVEQTGSTTENALVAEDFLSILLSVKSIKLDSSIFSDNAFQSLRDSSIILTPDGNEGRKNPFAPIGSDVVSVPENKGSTGGAPASAL